VFGFLTVQKKKDEISQVPIWDTLNFLAGKKALPKNIQIFKYRINLKYTKE
jgi:hypothetical protein